MPTPAAAGVIASIVHGFHKGGPLVEVGAVIDWRWSITLLLIAVSLAGLMTSKIRFYSFKDLPWGKKQPGFLILLLAIFGAVIWNFSELALLILACTYT
jgi:phosphatidylserine synthase